MTGKSGLYTTIGVLAATTVAGLAYAVWWDHKRRNDATFRRRLRKEQKKVSRQSKLADERAKAQRTEDLKAALEVIKTEPLPTSSEEKEQFFMQHVGTGEQLSVQGPAFHTNAALEFYRALRVYPSPVELIMIYQKTVPEPIFKIVMELTSMDFKERAEGYYDHFPPPEMNVEVKQAYVPSVKGTQLGRKTLLIAKRDFQAGEEIYKERPVVAALDIDLEGTAKYCSHCFRSIQSFLSLRPPEDLLGSAYCSKDCLLLASSLSQNLLFGTGSPLPGDSAARGGETERREAQTMFISHLKKSGRIQPLLAARFCARSVMQEFQKLHPLPSGLSAQSALPEPAPGAASYSFFDHLERLKFLEIPPREQEAMENYIIQEMLRTVLEGLEETVSEDKYLILKGKIAYNAIGVAPAGGRDNRPCQEGPIEKRESFRTPYGTNRQIGAGLYRVSSYLTHSCSPSVRPSFPSGTNELHLIANRDIPKGEELTMSYISIHGEKSICHERSEARALELARGWRFTCDCERCTGQNQDLVVNGVKPAAEPEEPIPEERLDLDSLRQRGATFSFPNGHVAA